MLQETPEFKVVRGKLVLRGHKVLQAPVGEMGIQELLELKDPQEAKDLLEAKE